MATLDFPAGIYFKEARITARSAVGVVTSPYTFAREPQDWGGERWEITFQFLRVTREHAAILESFLLKMRGGLHKVRLGDPWGSKPQGSNLGTPLVGAGNVAGSTSLIMKDWPSSSTGLLKANDYVEIEESLYRVLDDVDSDGSGDATVEVWPRLRKAHAEDVAMRTRNARALFALADPMALFDRNQIELYGASVNFVEAL